MEDAPGLAGILPAGLPGVVAVFPFEMVRSKACRVFLDQLLKWFLVYLRMFCEIMGWKCPAAWLRKMAKDESNWGEKPVV